MTPADADLAALPPAPPLRFRARLPLTSAFCEHERWLVETADGEHPLVAWAFADLEPGYTARAIAMLAPWRGVRHPRVAHLVGLFALAGKLLALHADDRGPGLRAAAARLPADEREPWVIGQIAGICDALAAAPAGHAYRGLDRQAIFIGPDGRARLRILTMGPLAERDQTRVGSGRIYGNIEHMSPEDVRALPVRPESNVFALAGALLHALTGAWPFAHHESPMQRLVAILQEEPAPAVLGACSPLLAEVIRTALAKAPEDRFADPAAFGAALRAIVPDADAVDAVISDRLVPWVPTAPALEDADPEPLLGPGCAQRWDALAPTASPDVRQCAACRQPVVQIRSLADLIPLAGKSCVHSRGMR